MCLLGRMAIDMGNLNVSVVAKTIVEKATQQSSGKLTIVEEEMEFFEYTCNVIDNFIKEIDACGFDVEFEDKSREILITVVFTSFEVGDVNNRIYDVMRRANKIRFNGSEDGETASMTLYLPGVWEEKIE